MRDCVELYLETACARKDRYEGHFDHAWIWPAGYYRAPRQDNCNVDVTMPLIVKLGTNLVHVILLLD